MNGEAELVALPFYRELVKNSLLNTSVLEFITTGHDRTEVHFADIKPLPPDSSGTHTSGTY
jgi:hypothetical protein